MITYFAVMSLIVLLLAVYSVIVYRIGRKIKRITNDILRIANKLNEDLVITESDLIDVREKIMELSNTLNEIGMEVEDEEVEGDCEEDSDDDSVDDTEIDDFYDGTDYIRFKFQ